MPSLDEYESGFIKKMKNGFTVGLYTLVRAENRRSTDFRSADFMNLAPEVV